MISVCDCEHEGQDGIHGTNQRVMNKTRKGTMNTTVYRCTVCNKEHSFNKGKTNNTNKTGE
jgi:RNase P subunit RPR2